VDATVIRSILVPASMECWVPGTGTRLTGWPGFPDQCRRVHARRSSEHPRAELVPAAHGD
jgi:hypothetical protein